MFCRWPSSGGRSFSMSWVSDTARCAMAASVAGSGPPSPMFSPAAVQDTPAAVSRWPRAAWPGHCWDRPHPPAITSVGRRALRFRPVLIVYAGRPACARALLISASTCAVAGPSDAGGLDDGGGLGVAVGDGVALGGGAEWVLADGVGRGRADLIRRRPGAPALARAVRRDGPLADPELPLPAPPARAERQRAAAWPAALAHGTLAESCRARTAASRCIRSTA